MREGEEKEEGKAEGKEEEGGVINPSRPRVRWPICLNEKEVGYWGGFKSLSER